MYVNEVMWFGLKVLKRKKEEHLKNKKSILEKSSLEKLIAQDEEKLKEMKSNASKTSENKFSYGQAAGLKDDLDVDDNDVGKFSNGMRWLHGGWFPTSYAPSKFRVYLA